MSIEDAESFLVRLMTDESLQQRIKAIETNSRQATLRELVKIGADEGFTFSAKEYEATVNSMLEDESELKTNRRSRSDLDLD